MQYDLKLTVPSSPSPQHSGSAFPQVYRLWWSGTIRVEAYGHRSDPVLPCSEVLWSRSRRSDMRSAESCARPDNTRELRGTKDIFIFIKNLKQPFGKDKDRRWEDGNRSKRSTTASLQRLENITQVFVTSSAAKFSRGKNNTPSYGPMRLTLQGKGQRILSEKSEACPATCGSQNRCVTFRLKSF